MAAKAQQAKSVTVWAVLVLTFRYVTGHHLDGRKRSDATFWHDGTEAEPTHWSRNPWWPRLAGWKRAAVTCWVPWTVAWGWFVHRAITEVLLTVAFALVLALFTVRGARSVLEWRHYRAKVWPLACAVAGVLDQPVSAPRSWVHVPRDYAAREDAEVIIDVPHDFTGSDRDMEDITRAVTVKLGIEAPDVASRLSSRHPRLIYTKSAPPPLAVTFADIRQRVFAAKASEVILGYGKPASGKSDAVSIDLDSETPMTAASMTTGDGKSALARNFAAQLAYHGALVIVLDYKWFSHMWADGLPNVCYARTPQEIHQVLCWLAHDELDEDGNVVVPSELTRRKQVHLAAERAGITADVGGRILVIAEERNATAKALKRHWRTIGGKGPCPSLEAMDEVGATGRQLCVNALYIAQRLSARASGSDGSADARENIGALILKDPTVATWKMLAEGHAQPPSSGHKGRYQLVTRKEVREFQGALLTDEEAREFATAGLVAVARHDMPFVTRRDLVPAGVRQDTFARQEDPEQGVVVGQSHGSLPAGEGPARAATLAAATAAGLFVSLAAARKAAHRQKWEPVGGDKNSGYEYALTDLYAYTRGRRKR